MRAGTGLVYGCLLLSALTAPIVAPAAGFAPEGSAQSQPTPAAVDGTERVDGDLACPAHLAEPGNGSVDRARIAELYPNPTIPGNTGEYVVLETPPNTAVGNWTITDGHTTASLPNETVSGRTALSMDPAYTDPLTDGPVLELEGYLRLAADGDRLELADGDGVIDAVTYERAPLARVWYRSDDSRPVAEDGSGSMGTGRWWPRDASCLPPSSAAADEATAFVKPDETEVPLETLRSADDRIRLAGYTLTSEAVADELVAAADRGVEVTVLLEAGPVGGTPAATKDRLDELERAGVSVRALGGEGARYRYHHPKYAVADDSVLVMTENWNPSGVGGASSRGWGVRLEDPALATDLAAVFDADFEGWDTRSWREHRSEATFVEDEPSTGEFPAEHGPAAVAIDDAELLLAPDNAENRLEDIINRSEESILIKQPRIGDADVSLLEAALEAARRGVEVRILLDSTWYVEEDNEALADELEGIADEEELPLEVRLVDSGTQFEKIHAKGVVVDDETAVVGSANWNNNSLRNNREVLVALHGAEAAAYYASVFEDDWSGESWWLPLELLAVLLLALLGAGFVGSKYVRVELSSRAGSHSRVPRRDRPPPSSRPGRR